MKLKSGAKHSYDRFPEKLQTGWSCTGNLEDWLPKRRKETAKLDQLAKWRIAMTPQLHHYTPTLSRRVVRKHTFRVNIEVLSLKYKHITQALHKHYSACGFNNPSFCAYMCVYTCRITCMHVCVVCVCLFVCLCVCVCVCVHACDIGYISKFILFLHL